MKPILFFDESGNSGANLLDKEQPVFVLASVNLSDDEAEQILQKSNKEYKFSNLKKSAKGRNLVLSVLNSPLMSDDRFLISGFHKLFMVITKMVDLLIEPLAYENGIDLYDQGANIAMSNMLFYCLPEFLGQNLFDKITNNFVNMVRTASMQNKENFYEVIDYAYEMHRNKAYAGELALFVASRDIAKAKSAIWTGDDLDPAIPAFVQQASVWTSRLLGPFHIAHDPSKPIFKNQAVLESMMSVKDEIIEVGYDRRKMTFPICSEEIEFVDSSNNPQLQVADILAGSVAYFLKARCSNSEDHFCKELLKTRVFSGTLNPVWPEQKVTPEELGTVGTGGIDPIEYVSKYIFERFNTLDASSICPE